jgi:hypothetical protein
MDKKLESRIARLERLLNAKNESEEADYNDMELEYVRNVKYIVDKMQRMVPDLLENVEGTGDGGIVDLAVQLSRDIGFLKEITDDILD